MESLNDLVQDWLIDLKAARKSPGTLIKYEQVLRAYIHSAGDSLGGLSRRSIRCWLASVDQLAPATQRTYFNALAVFCGWLVAEKVLPENPMTGLQRPAAPAVPVQPFAPDQVQALLDTCGKQRRTLVSARTGETKSEGYQGETFVTTRDRLLITLLASSGMRLSELYSITLEQIDMGQQVIAIIGKGRKPRIVPYSDATALALRRYMRHRRQHKLAHLPELFLGQRGPLGADGVDAVLKRRARKAGLKDVHAHRFRHTFADNWLSEGGSEQSLMCLAGWSSSSMVTRYTKARQVDRALAEYRLRGR